MNIVSFENTPSQTLTMSSREIAELLELRHDKVKQSIERLSNRSLIAFTPVGEMVQIGSGAMRESMVYHVNKRDSYVVVAQLSPEFTARLVDRWQELEEQAAQGFKVPCSFREALLLAAEQQQVIEDHQRQLQLQAPKVQVYDNISDSINAKTLNEVAKVLGTGEIRLNRWLRKHGYLMKHGTIPYQRYVDRGLFRIVQKAYVDPKTGEKVTYSQTLVTGKGITYFARKLGTGINANLPLN